MSEFADCTKINELIVVDMFKTFVVVVLTLVSE